MLAGHPVGNLMLTGLTEMHGGDTVRALDEVAELLGCCGRVLPMADVPLDLVARVESTDPDDPERTRTIRGPGGDRRDARAGCARSCSHRPTRRSTPPCSRRSPRPTWSRSGPGSWYTSVLPHLLVPAAAAALAATPAQGGRGAQPGAAARGDGRLLAGGASAACCRHIWAEWRCTP